MVKSIYNGGGHTKQKLALEDKYGDFQIEELTGRVFKSRSWLPESSYLCTPLAARIDGET